MATGVVSWSQTAASNATADSTVNWQEGQAPSSVNDSARAVMASVAKYRDDISGAIATGGTSTAYTVTSYQVFPSLTAMHGQMIAFTPHVINGATVTLNVDGLGAKPLRASPSVELPSNSLLQGTPYVATYNNTDGAWYLQGMTNPYQIPLAAGFDFWGSTAPSSCYAFPYGQAISRTTYATLYSLIGIQYGSGDGATTFNLPDKRGRVSAALDTMGGTSAARLTSPASGGVSDSTVLGSAGGVKDHTLTTSQIPSHSHANTLTDPGHYHPYAGFSQLVTAGSGGQSAATTPATQNTSISFTGITITNANAGGGGAHNNVQPTIICNYLMRII